MKPRKPEVFFGHILDSIQLVEGYIHHVSRAQFLKSPALQDAIIRRVEVIGEAVRNIDPMIRKEYPEIPWRFIAGMRDILIHEYFAVDLNATWDTVKQDLPKLKRQIEKIMKDL